MPLSVSAAVLRVFLFFLLFIGCLAPWNAMADGKVFRAHDVAVDPVIPDQRALLHWMDGQETLIIETSVTGGGENLGWVVPLPAPPEVEAAPTRIFDSVKAAFSPELEKVSARFLYGISAALLMIMIWPPRCLHGSKLGLRVMAFLLVSPLIVFGAGQGSEQPELVFFAAMLAPASILVAVAAARSRPLHQIIAVAWFGVLCWALWLFSTSSGRIMSRSARGVEVISVQNAGDFRATVLRSDTGALLSAWLRDNGYDIPPETVPAIEEYVRAGWIFTAMKVIRPAAPTKEPLAPVTFRFPAEHPVYPMRLTATATGGRALLLDLYVLGPKAATAPGMTVKRCDKVRILGRGASAEFQRWADPSHIGTWLRGEIPAASLRQDLLPQWVDFKPVMLPKVHTPASAFLSSLNRCGLVILLAGLVSLYLPVPAEPGSSRENSGPWRSHAASRMARIACGLTAIAGLAWGCFHCSGLPKVGTTAERRDRELTRHLGDVSETLDAAREETMLSPDFGAASMAEAVRRRLRSDLPVEVGFSEAPGPQVTLLDTATGVEGWFRSKNGDRFLLKAWDKTGKADGRPGKRPYRF